MLRVAGWCTVLVVLIAGCGGGGGVSVVPVPPPPGPAPGPQVATLSGDISVFVPQQENVVETEPNDTQLQAHFLGDMVPGRTVSVVGHVRGGVDTDTLDAFRVLASQRVKISVNLEWEGTGDPDFAAGIWDFTAQQYVEVFLDDPAVSPTTGEFHVKGAFALVVSVLQGEGDYVVTMTSEGTGLTIPEREPNNEFFYFGQFLGEVLVGDSVVLAGRGHPVNDIWDSVTVICPEAARLDLSCHIPDTGLPEFGEYDIDVYDITGGEAQPPLVDSFIWGATGVDAARGQIDVAAGTLLQVFVFSWSGDATYHLGISGNPPQLGQNAQAQGAQIHRALPRAQRPSGRIDLPKQLAKFAEVPLEFVAGQALVVPLEADGFAGYATRMGCRLTKSVPGGPSCITTNLPKECSDNDRARHTLRLVECLRRSGRVKYAEPNFIYKPMAEPDDTDYTLQWHYPMLNLPQAWDITTGSNNVIVAVIDSGMAAHPDLAGRQIPGYDFIAISDDARDGDAYDPDPTDEGDLFFGDHSSFHGTHVAGTIGAATNNGLGVAGVTWATRIMHLRVLGVGGGSALDIRNAILYAAGLPNGSQTVPAERAHIINMSLGGPGFSQALQDACRDARNAGVVIFASAGNEGGTTPSYPAANDGVIAIGAVDIAKNRALYSNYGSWLDIVAPGGGLTDDNLDGQPDGVLSTVMNDLVSPPEPTYAFYPGTSMACPHAAGVAALMLAVDPTLTPDEIEAILKATAEDLGAPGVDDEYGFGLINALEALLQAQGAGDPQIPPVLGLDSVAVAFAPNETTRRVNVTNLGGQTLLVGPLTVVTKSGETWLSQTTVPGTVAASDTSAIDVSVDRTGLADGVYFGRIQVESNGGVLQVQVLLNVESVPSGPPDIEIFVRLVDVDTGAIARETSVNPSTTLAFTLANVPPGTYRLLAGSDLNFNGILGEPGELLGVYPHTDSPILVNVQAGDDRGPFKFTVGPSGVLPTTK